VGGLESAKQRDEERGTELQAWHGFELGSPAEHGGKRRRREEDSVRADQCFRRRDEGVNGRLSNPVNVAFSRAGYVAG
jgi:hypothetical protein